MHLYLEHRFHGLKNDMIFIIQALVDPKLVVGLILFA